MPKPNIQIQLQNSTDAGIGMVTAAASVRWSLGLPGKRMRKLGCFALVYVTEGEGLFRDELGTRHQVGAGDMLLLFPDVGHAYGPARGGRWDEIYVLFEGRVFDLWREQNRLTPENPVAHLAPVASWQHRLEQVWADSPSPLACVCRLQSFLAEAESAGQGLETTPSWLLLARQHLEGRIGEPMDIAHLARRLGMSYESFRKKFRRLEGMSPGHYRKRKVMDSAAHQLLQTDLPLKNVADAMGFCDEFHFSRQFKKTMGVSPGAFRRRIRSG